MDLTEYPDDELERIKQDMDERMMGLRSGKAQVQAEQDRRAEVREARRQALAAESGQELGLALPSVREAQTLDAGHVESAEDVRG